MVRRVRFPVVGGGCSGALTAVRLISRPSPVDEPWCSPNRGSLGRGTAYSTRTSCHLLNVPAGRMSAFPEDPRHFTSLVDRPGLHLYGSDVRAASALRRVPERRRRRRSRAAW